MPKKFKGFGTPPEVKPPTFEQILEVDRDIYTRTTTTPEAYDKLLEHGFCEPVESVTSSMMGAVLQAAKGNMDAAIYSATAAYNYPSPITYASERWHWMRQTIQKNIGIDIGEPENYGLTPPSELEKVYRLTDG